MTAQQIYSDAASVRADTGVDPAIIATIVQTETNLSFSPPFNLGIGTAAVRGGRGTSGGSIASSNTFGGTQPAGFWTYQNGAEAARAFRDYIMAYQPALAPYLNNAVAFFNPTGAIFGSHYYVPTAGEAARAGSADQATYNYYARWQKTAEGFPSDITGSTPAGTDPFSQAGAILFPKPLSSDSSDSGPRDYFQPIPGFGPWPGVRLHFGFLWAVLFFAAGVGAILFGIGLYFHTQIEQAVRTAARAV